MFDSNVSYDSYCCNRHICWLINIKPKSDCNSTTATQLLGSNSSNQTISPAKQQQPFVSKGISFDIDNVTFSHHMASVNGIQIHYVIGGQGNPVVLLHGWPQTWYEWRHVMPALAKNYTVIVPDLRGLGFFKASYGL